MSLSREPAVWVGVVQAVIALVVVLGVDLPAGADAAVLAVVVAVGAVLTRSQVTPVAVEEHRAEG